MFLHLLLCACEMLSMAQTCENIQLLLATESLLGQHKECNMSFFICAVRIQSVVKEVSFCLSHSAAVRLSATVHHGNSARGGVCLHADVWWQHCYYGTKKEICNLKRKSSSFAGVEHAIISVLYPEERTFSGHLSPPNNDSLLSLVPHPLFDLLFY